MVSKNLEISASAMCFDWKNVDKELTELIENKIDYLHFDFIDGIFAPDFGLGTSIVNSIRENVSTPADYHLMVEEPSRLFDSFKFSKGDILTIHQECSRNLHRDLIKIKRMGLRAGVALCPATTIDSLEYIIEDIDLILIMTVNPGFKGQKLIPQMLHKIETLLASGFER